MGLGEYEIVLEGETAYCCVQIFHGIAEEPHVLLIATVTDTASGLKTNLSAITSNTRIRYTPLTAASNGSQNIDER